MPSTRSFIAEQGGNQSLETTRAADYGVRSQSLDNDHI